VEDFERLRVGLRRGLMWHGRERLAQTYYHQALKHYSEGDVRHALWYLRLCLHNRPCHLSGIKLREEILQRREWEDEGSVGRDFVSRLILEEQGPGADWPRFGRPAPTANPDPVFGPAGFDTTQETTEQ
jgi:hypothetical protein